MTDHNLAPSLPPVEAQLRQLVQRWRELYALVNTREPVLAPGWKSCADELEAVIQQNEADLQRRLREYEMGKHIPASLDPAACRTCGSTHRERIAGVWLCQICGDERP